MLPFPIGGLCEVLGDRKRCQMFKGFSVMMSLRTVAHNTTTSPKHIGGFGEVVVLWLSGEWWHLRATVVKEVKLNDIPDCIDWISLMFAA